jgi:hypothetical protein
MTEVQRQESQYIAAGSPTRCILPSCQKPFDGSCTRGNDGHFYCSQECADAGSKIDLSQVELLPKRASR